MSGSANADFYKQVPSSQYEGFVTIGGLGQAESETWIRSPEIFGPFAGILNEWLRDSTTVERKAGFHVETDGVPAELIRFCKIEGVRAGRFKLDGNNVDEVVEVFDEAVEAYRVLAGQNAKRKYNIWIEGQTPDAKRAVHIRLFKIITPYQCYG
ncbi:hypothetical protein HDV00_007180 [Rhizophlyctis rosea]|nr:hypothetical protein HDV00_007180 [Rhizophlyctis rosea]